MGMWASTSLRPPPPEFEERPAMGRAFQGQVAVLGSLAAVVCPRRSLGSGGLFYKSRCEEGGGARWVRGWGSS